MSTSWQTDVFKRLRSSIGGYQLGELYKLIESDIPLHIATRFAVRSRHPDWEPATARWMHYIAEMRKFAVPNRDDAVLDRETRANEIVKLRYETCSHCGAIAYPRGWSSSIFECIQCKLQFRDKKMDKAKPNGIDRQVDDVALAMRKLDQLNRQILDKLKMLNEVPKQAPAQSVTLGRLESYKRTLDDKEILGQQLAALLGDYQESIRTIQYLNKNLFGVGTKPAAKTPIVAKVVSTGFDAQRRSDYADDTTES